MLRVRDLNGVGAAAGLEGIAFEITESIGGRSRDFPPILSQNDYSLGDTVGHTVGVGHHAAADEAHG